MEIRRVAVIGSGRLVLAGYLGHKTGKGFYDYATSPPSPNDWLVGDPT